MEAHEELSAELVRVQGPVEAALVRGILESNGIPARCAARVPHSVLPFTIDGPGDVRIFVAQTALASARALISGHRHAGLTAVRGGRAVVKPPRDES